ncbi:MAG TPA: hypothetical protein VD931_07175 [Baekduia sp.]|nr:hypothetical protein [Baekduia sp.]
MTARTVALAVAGFLLLGGEAAAHSIVRVQGADVSYTSSDATSLNTLTVRAGRDEVEFRDPTVDGGIDPGSCRPGETDANGFVVQVFCPRGALRLARIDLGEREDALDATGSPVALQALGGPGADRLTAGPQADVLVGGDGDDRLDGGPGDDRVLGGDGADVLGGGDGADDVQAGLGSDEVDAGGGDDQVRVRDGLRDVVRCGDGADRVDADTLDEIDVSCEAVTRAVTAAPPGAAPAARDVVAPAVRAGARARQRLRRGAVEVLAVSSEAGTVAASGFLDVGALRLPVPTVRRRVAVPGAGVRLAVRLSSSQRRQVAAALRRGRRVVVRVGVVATDRAGNSRRAGAPAVRVVG